MGAEVLQPIPRLGQPRNRASRGGPQHHVDLVVLDKPLSRSLEIATVNTRIDEAMQGPDRLPQRACRKKFAIDHILRVPDMPGGG